MLTKVSYNIHSHIILENSMSENMDRVDHSRVKAVKFIHQLVFEMDRPAKVCIVSEAEYKTSSLGFLRDETLMEG